MTAVARTVDADARVPIVTRIPPTDVAVRKASARAGRWPPKSDMTSKANHPKTAKMTFCPPCRTRVLKARTGGMTMAARAARRSAAKPGSAGAATESFGRRDGTGVSVVTMSVPLAPTPLFVHLLNGQGVTRKKGDGDDSKRN